MLSLSFRTSELAEEAEVPRCTGVLYDAVFACYTCHSGAFRGSSQVGLFLIGQ